MLLEISCAYSGIWGFEGELIPPYQYSVIIHERCDGFQPKGQEAVVILVGMSGILRGVCTLASTVSRHRNNCVSSLNLREVGGMGVI